jgi:hypothetical protein
VTELAQPIANARRKEARRIVQHVYVHAVGAHGRNAVEHLNAFHQLAQRVRIRQWLLQLEVELDGAQETGTARIGS